MKAADHLSHMRATAPLVQNITNYVAMNIMANALLAAGASPAMVHAEEEAAEFAGIAQALTINIGTPDPRWVSSMVSAASAMSDLGKPWVLDPVAAGATTFRRNMCAQLMALNPTIIRGNASEIMALAGNAGGGRGADTTDAVHAAEESAQKLARQTGGVVAITGAVDFVTDGAKHYRVENGHEMMTRITALGCALTGIVGAFAVDQPPLEATVAALTYHGTAGDIAAEQTGAPGSFQVAFLDALYTLTPDQLDSRTRIIPA